MFHMHTFRGTGQIQGVSKDQVMAGRQLGRPRITWLSTVQQDLKQNHLMLPEAADLAQNRPLWRMMSTYGATQS